MASDDRVSKVEPASRSASMRTATRTWIAALLFLIAMVSPAQAQTTPQVVDIPTRPGVTQRMLVLSPPKTKAAVILFAGGHGGLQIFPNGSFNWGAGNFLVRTRQLFADQGLMVAIIDAPSDRQSPPYLGGFRQTPEHAADVKAAIAWMREQSKAPVWLVGTSRGTQSAAYVATELSGREGPDGIVLSSTILVDERSRPVPAMPLDKIRIPVLVVHHEQDGCALCAFAEVPALMAKLSNSPRKELLAFNGGDNKGAPCEAMAFHGFNGLEREVVQQIAAWTLTK
ncbi:alpha/beta hydrolase family protein [Variovorax sp. RT4R15]|uniref:alpha/beta hydrolase family protein n=1 Tax=Variovorax sp. RT4R15 TaxID=3443737 RepID=UPI003F449AAF